MQLKTRARRSCGRNFVYIDKVKLQGIIWPNIHFLENGTLKSNSLLRLLCSEDVSCSAFFSVRDKM